MTSIAPDVRAPQQARSQRSLERTLDAAERLIRERGFGALTVAELVQRAQISTGSFYARFEDKDALLRVLQDRVLGRIESRLRTSAPSAFAGQDLAARVGRLVSATLLATADAPLFRAFITQATVDAVMRERGERLMCRLREHFRLALAEVRSEIGHDDPDLAIDVSFSICFALVERRLLWGADGGASALEPRQLSREISRAVLGYLRADRPAKRRASRAARATPRPRRPR